MTIDDKLVDGLIAKRQAAERVIEGMPEGPRKEKTFEMAFQRLLNGNGEGAGTRRGTRSRRARTPVSGPTVPPSAPRSRRGSPRVRLDELLKEGFFDTARRLPEIVENLRARGYIYRQESLSPHLLKMTKDKVLRREQEAREDRRAIWVYERAE